VSDAECRVSLELEIRESMSGTKFFADSVFVGGEDVVCSKTPEKSFVLYLLKEFA